jgi:hypothetical protein
MKTLPNGLTIFNATPHTIRFWAAGWQEPIEIETDEVVNATIEEHGVGYTHRYALVTTRFTGNDAGLDVIRRALRAGADLIVGSIIAAQAYPGEIVAMCPAEGYERVPPAEKRMRPDKFTVYR